MGYRSGVSGDAPAALAAWLAGGPSPERDIVKAAVKASLAELARRAPGHSVEVRVPPFAAAQCIEGPRHGRGNPPNVVETDARTWLALAAGRVGWEEALATGALVASGSRAGAVGGHLPLTLAQTRADTED